MIAARSPQYPARRIGVSEDVGVGMNGLTGGRVSTAIESAHFNGAERLARSTLPHTGYFAIHQSFWQPCLTTHSHAGAVKLTISLHVPVRPQSRSITARPSRFIQVDWSDARGDTRAHRVHDSISVMWGCWVEIITSSVHVPPSNGEKQRAERNWASPFGATVIANALWCYSTLSTPIAPFIASEKECVTKG